MLERQKVVFEMAGHGWDIGYWDLDRSPTGWDKWNMPK
jgi:hypothetical protein